MQKKLILLLFTLTCCKAIIAQQDPQFTQYMYNTIAVNPGYAGSRGALTIGGLHRLQWVGIDGAPKTQTLYLHSPVFTEQLGLGLSVVNDKIGPINQTFIYGDLAYHLKLSETIKLGLGLKAGLNMFQPKISTLNTSTSNDPSFVNATLQRSIAPNLGTGVYLYSEKFYLGASIPRLMQNKLNAASGSALNILEKRHIFLIGGLVQRLNDQFKLKPTLLTKITEGAPVSIDATLELLVKDMWSVGIAHRFKESVSALFGINLNEQLKVGFAYDHTLSKLRKYNSGSFEIMLQYDFIMNKDKIKSPRYF